LDSPRGLAGETIGLVAAALQAAACVLVVLPYWQALGSVSREPRPLRIKLEKLSRQLVQVIDWLTGGGTRIPALVGALRRFLGASLFGSHGSALSRLARPICLSEPAWSSGPTAIPGISPGLFRCSVFSQSAWLLLTVLQFLSYNVLISYGILSQFKFDPFMQWLVYAPFYALLVAQWFLRQKRSRT